MQTGKRKICAKQWLVGMKQKWWGRLARVVLVLACVCVVWSLVRTLNSASIVMDIHFEEGAQGKNPDQSRFSASEILAPEVLNAAAKALGERVDGQRLGRHLTLSDLTLTESVERVDRAIYNGKETYAEYPVRYRLSYHIVSPAAAQDGPIAVLTALWEQILLPGKGKILRTIAECHEVYFRENHLYSDAVLSVDWDTMDSMDHYNRMQAVELAVQRAGRLLEEKCASAAEFVSAQSGTSFADLNDRLSRITAVDINNYKAYILDKGLTFDREVLLQQLRNARDSRQEEYERQSAAYEVCMQAISGYDPDTTRVVFIPSLDTEDAFYMSRTKVGMDLLIERANKARSAADQAQHDARYYAYLLECFDAAQSPSREQLRRGEELYADIKSKVIPVFEQAGQMLEERREEDMQYVDYSTVDYGLYPVSVVIGCVKPFVLLSVCAYLAVCAWQVVEPQLKKRKEEVAHVGK